MARPLRIEFPGALYHVTSRGNERQLIYSDNGDRNRFLDILAECSERYHWHCYAYCLMDNHYHLLIETAEATLSRGMRQLNGVYTQQFNGRHNRVGHLFQGRYKAILVQKQTYLLELARYIVLNPLRADMIKVPEAWPWSSYRATAGLVQVPDWLASDWILSIFSERRDDAVAEYRRFVLAGLDRETPWRQLKNQIYLGSDKFVEEMQCQLRADQVLTGVPRQQRLSPRQALDWYAGNWSDRKQAMALAYRSGHYTLEQIGEYFGVCRMTVSRAAKKGVKSEN